MQEVVEGVDKQEETLVESAFLTMVRDPELHVVNFSPQHLLLLVLHLLNWVNPTGKEIGLNRRLVNQNLLLV